MKSQHTPGPWQVIPMQDTIWTQDGETKIATVADLPWVESPTTGRRHSDTATEQANARLIAAAPDLLEFAQFVADGRAGNIEEMARQLVAKATGN